MVTNPPFSLFREFVAQLVEYDKKFLIIGNQNAMKYKEDLPADQEQRGLVRAEHSKRGHESLGFQTAIR